MCNLNVIVLLEFISKDLYTSLLKVAKFNFLPKHEAEIRPLNNYFMDIFVGTLFV